MKISIKSGLVALALSLLFSAAAQTNTPNNPTWWNKYQYLSTHGASGGSGTSNSLVVGPNVDVSNECGPQSETYITLYSQKPNNLAGGSNEIFRDPMRAYSSSDGGASWSGADAPLPPPLSGTNDSRFGSDPSLVFDTAGNLFYSYIVVFFGGGRGIDGTEMAVAKSTDGGKSFPSATFFSFSSGKDHFNDKPMITADNNLSSPFRDRIYAAWDAASGGSSGGGNSRSSFLRSWGDVHDNARRRSKGSGEVDCRRSIRWSERRVVRRLERLQRAGHHLQPLD